MGTTEPEFRRRIDDWLVESRLATREEVNDPNNTTLDQPRIRAARDLGLSETEYRFNWMPLGGYVKMMGQEDFVVDKSGELKVKDDPDSFSSKSVGKRMVIISAGVIMNLIFAGIAFAIVIMVGRFQPPAIVGETVPDSPAGRAGLLPGDHILAINGTPVHSFPDLMREVTLSDLGEPLVLDVERNGKPVEPKPRIMPEFKKEEKLRQIGISTPVTRRVLLASMSEQRDPAADELQNNDEFYKVVEDGKETVYDDIRDFRREMLEARGAPIDVIVRRPRNASAISPEVLADPRTTVDSIEAPVKVAAIWTLVPETPGDANTRSLLGLVPRVTLTQVIPDKPLAKAGVQNGDVVLKIGDILNPTQQQFTDAIQKSEGKPVPIEVKRVDAPNHGLRGLLVRFCVLNRETLIEAAVKNGVEAAGVLARERLAPYAARNNLSRDDQDKLIAKLNELKDAAAWRSWLDNVDRHVLSPIEPRSKFSLLSEQLPTIDAQVIVTDEDGIVLADVVGDREGESPSAASRAGVAAGAVIVRAAGEEVGRWWKLSEVFRLNAGKTIPLTYRVGSEYHEVKFQVPGCISHALNLRYGERIISIDGQTSFRPKGAEHDIALPDWQAVRGLLAARTDKTVTVKYVTIDGETRTGDFAVLADNADPWVMRVQFYPAFGSYVCYPLYERFSESNPLKAVARGFEEAYVSTVTVIKTIRHLLFTGQVGKEKVSGPVGILKIGTDVAEKGGLIQLLWFMGMISANLAVINFLPMPIVDGGHFMFLLLEKIRGEPLSIKTQIATQIVGIALIATLFLLVTYQDILNIIFS